MKIINVRTASLQPIPFILGQSGRGRHAEEIKISNRPGQVPAGPEDVSYFTFGDPGARHCILTRADNRGGVLIRINTSGVYTRSSYGRISLVGGQAACLASGQWAEGQAGNIASGPDQLWHVESPSLFEVVLQGGVDKGMGLRYLVIGRSMMPRLLKPDELVQMIATDSDPEVTDTVRLYAALIGTVGGDSARGDSRRQAIAEAIRVADLLETQEPTSESPSVIHYAHGDIRAHVIEHGIAIPVLYADSIGGVSGVAAATLVPGTQSMLSLSVGPGGGKRYSYETVIETGVRRITSDRQRSSRENVLYVVDASPWMVAWISKRDGVATEYTIADAGGIHTYTPAWSDGPDGGYRTEPWPGVSVGPTPTFGGVFAGLTLASQLAPPVAHAVVESPSSSDSPTQVADLAARFNRR